MDGFSNLTAQLNKALTESPEYQEYTSAKAALFAKPEYRAKVDDFRKKQVGYEIRKMNGEAHDPSESFALSNEYADICLIEECNNFFVAEINLLGLITKTYDEVFKDIELDMEFMD